MLCTSSQNRGISVEANWRALLAEIAHANNGLLANTEEVFWYANCAPASFLNGVLFANFTSDAARRAAEIVQAFQQRARPWLWTVGPSSGPAELRAILQDLGLTLLETTPGMMLHLEHFGSETPRDLEIIEVHDAVSSELWLSVRALNHALDAPGIDGWRRIYFAQNRTIRGLTHFVGLFRGKPVATASLFIESDTAGIYHVDTVPAFRRRGFGTAMTAHALSQAVGRGYSTAALSASAEAAPLYREMGFQEVTRFLTFQPQSGQPGGKPA
jgi:GNAT superfamily N-acetyltransferase